MGMFGILWKPCGFFMISMVGKLLFEEGDYEVNLAGGYGN